MAREPRARRCKATRKMRFFSEARALKFAEGAHLKGYYRAYVCPFCQSWHLTSQPYRSFRPPTQIISGEAG